MEAPFFLWKMFSDIGDFGWMTALFCLPVRVIPEYRYDNKNSVIRKIHATADLQYNEWSPQKTFKMI